MFIHYRVCSRLGASQSWSLTDDVVFAILLPITMHISGMRCKATDSEPDVSRVLAVFSCQFLRKPGRIDRLHDRKPLRLLEVHMMDEVRH